MTLLYYIDLTPIVQIHTTLTYLFQWKFFHKTTNTGVFHPLSES